MALSSHPNGSSSPGQDDSPTSSFGQSPQQEQQRPMVLVNGLQPLSCLRCASRKVKCQRTEPCRNCLKHGVSCEYRSGTPYKRKRQDTNAPSRPNKCVPETVESLQKRLSRYENLLRNMGMDVKSMDVSALDNMAMEQSKDRAKSPPGPQNSKCHPHFNGTSPSRQFSNGAHEHPGRLIAKGGKSRYLQGNLWSKMGDELVSTNAFLPDSSEDEDEDDSYMENGSADILSGDLVLASSPRGSSLHALYPTPAQFAKLWQAFLDNVHPITMILHAPTEKQVLFDAVKNDGPVARDVEAKLFAVISLAVLSLSDVDCLGAFAETRTAMLARFRRGARYALAHTKFLLSSSFSILQAYLLYLSALQPEMDPRAFWNLTGIAVRNAQRLGLHIDTATKGLTTFEIQMRRRIWYQIVIMDVVTAQIAGTSSDLNLDESESTPPANLNDADLHPDMTFLPADRVGATDMLFCRLRYKIFRYMIINMGTKSIDLSVTWLTGGAATKGIGEKVKLIKAMEQDMEDDILRYCDPLQPVHYLATSIARLVICKVRFIVHHPRQYQNTPGGVPEEVRAKLFKDAVRVLQYDNTAHRQPTIQRFLWHSHFHFQWTCLVFLLGELRTCIRGDDASRAWDEIRMSYEYRPEIFQGRLKKVPLYDVVTKMTLDAWSMREQAFEDLARSGESEPLKTPDFIHKLRAARGHGSHTGSGESSRRDTPGREPPKKGQRLRAQTVLHQQLSSDNSGNIADGSQWPDSPAFAAETAARQPSQDSERGNYASATSQPCIPAPESSVTQDVPLYTRKAEETGLNNLYGSSGYAWTQQKPVSTSGVPEQAQISGTLGPDSSVDLIPWGPAGPVDWTMLDSLLGDQGFNEAAIASTIWAPAGAA